MYTKSVRFFDMELKFMLYLLMQKKIEYVEKLNFTINKLKMKLAIIHLKLVKAHLYPRLFQ